MVLLSQLRLKGSDAPVHLRRVRHLESPLNKWGVGVGKMLRVQLSVNKKRREVGGREGRQSRVGGGGGDQLVVLLLDLLELSLRGLQLCLNSDGHPGTTRGPRGATVAQGLVVLVLLLLALGLLGRLLPRLLRISLGLLSSTHTHHTKT